MTSSVALSLTNSAITSLQDAFGSILPTLFPVVILVTILFAGIFVLKSLWHRHV